MADLFNFAVSQQGQTVRVTGEYRDDDGNVLVQFGQGAGGTSFITWFQALPVSAQIEFISVAAVPWMLRNLQGEWPIVFPNP